MIHYSRRNTSFLAPHEAKVLGWLASRMPAWVTPDRLTLFGFGGALATAAGFVMSAQGSLWLLLGVAGCIAHWFGDSLDGTIARFRDCQRPIYGAFVDQTVDILSVTVALVGLGLSPMVRMDVAAGAIAGYLLLTVLGHLKAMATGIFDIALNGVGGTEMRIVFVLLILAGMAWPVDSVAIGHGFSAYDCVVAGLTLVALIMYVRESLLWIWALRHPEAPAPHVRAHTWNRLARHQMSGQALDR